MPGQGYQLRCYSSSSKACFSPSSSPSCTHASPLMADANSGASLSIQRPLVSADSGLGGGSGVAVGGGVGTDVAVGSGVGTGVAVGTSAAVAIGAGSAAAVGDSAASPAEGGSSVVVHAAHSAANVATRSASATDAAQPLIESLRVCTSPPHWPLRGPNTAAFGRECGRIVAHAPWASLTSRACSSSLPCSTILEHCGRTAWRR